jgi:hypothetical protein
VSAAESIGCAIVLSLGLACSSARPETETRQEHVHHLAHGVMPFDVSKVTHVFEMTDDGGVLRVIAKDLADAMQIGLVQEHLRVEAERFRQGDFSDPARLHGEDMPGLRELSAGAAHVTVTYEALPDGAEIRFTTQDAHLVTAVHRWFGAQLSEHGADAVSR